MSSLVDGCEWSQRAWLILRDDSGRLCGWTWGRFRQRYFGTELKSTPVSSVRMRVFRRLDGGYVRVVVGGTTVMIERVAGTLYRGDTISFTGAAWLS